MFSLAAVLAAATPVPLGAATKAPFGAVTPVPRGAPDAGATVNPQVYPPLQNLGLVHKTPMAANLPWLTHTFGGIFVVLALSLIVLLAFQTTKQEGLSGTIGGRVESAYRPRLGFDQQLARLTSYVAIGFVFFAVVLSITGI